MHITLRFIPQPPSLLVRFTDKPVPLCVILNVSLNEKWPTQFAFDTIDGHVYPAGTLAVLVFAFDEPIVTITVPACPYRACEVVVGDICRLKCKTGVEKQFRGRVTQHRSLTQAAGSYSCASMIRLCACATACLRVCMRVPVLRRGKVPLHTVPDLSTDLSCTVVMIACFIESPFAMCILVSSFEVEASCPADCHIVNAAAATGRFQRTTSRVSFVNSSSILTTPNPCRCGMVSA